MRYNYTTYNLQLAHDLEWEVISTQAVAGWVKKFVSIMQLKACKRNNHPRAIFLQRELGKEEGYRDLMRRIPPNINNNLPHKGWKVWDRHSIRIWSHAKVADFIYEIRADNDYFLNIMKMQIALYPIYQKVHERGGLSLHTALLEYHGRGILLIGQGGVGKSTCCQRLPFPWQPLCDDQAIVVVDSQKRYCVHPFPTWSDHLFRRSKRTWDIQRYFPLAAIFFLEQSKRDEVIPVKQGQAAVSINESIVPVWFKNGIGLDFKEKIEFKKSLFNNACGLAKLVPSFRLRVSIRGRFWKKMEKVLNYA